ncbi:MAG: MBL fold metallo-hydrolase [Candidatus Asgardarchaeia archaeon]
MVKHLKLIVLNDNEGATGFKNSWGWSALLVSENWKILFDADSDPRVIEYNVEKLGIDLKDVTFAVLSHYHGDHYGGFEYVGKVNPGLKIFVPPGNPSFLRDWGLDPVIINKPQKLLNDVWTTGPLGWIKEQAIGVKVDKIGIIVVVGCSHPGVSKLASKAREVSGEEVYLTIGGYHSPSARELDELASLSKYICPAHCSGSSAKRYVKLRYPEKFYHVNTGMILEINEKGIRAIS